MESIDDQIKEITQSFAQKLPQFKDGRIDYSLSNEAPVLTVFVMYKNKLLLLKRSNRVRTYQGKWNTVAGYLDDYHQTLKEKIHEELREETGITPTSIRDYTYGSRYQFTDNKSKKTWIVFPAKVILSEKPSIELDWEHTKYQWIKAEDISSFDTVPNLRKSLSSILPRENK